MIKELTRQEKIELFHLIQLKIQCFCSEKRLLKDLDDDQIQEIRNAFGEVTFNGKVRISLNEELAKDLLYFLVTRKFIKVEAIEGASYRGYGKTFIKVHKLIFTTNKRNTQFTSSIEE